MSRQIAVLLTSNDTSAFARAFPNDGEKVRSLLKPLRPDWMFRVWSVKDGEFPPEVTAADGYVITGSPASVHDPFDWIAKLLAFVRELHAARTPLVGLCFGHQAIALALGGRVERNPRGWRMGIAETHIHRSEAWAEPAARTIRLYASHCEQVTRLPPDAEVFGGDEFCPNAFYTIGRHTLTTQYHPEFTPAFMNGLTDELDGKLPPDVISQARRELQQPAEGAIFSRWMACFLEQSRT